MEIQPVGQDAEVLYRLCLEHPQGITQVDLQANGWSDLSQLMQAANMLSSQGRLQFHAMSNGTLVFQAADLHTAAKFRGLDSQHMLVYQLIEKAGNKGVWSKMLKDHSNLQQHTITKVTKELMRRQLVKEVKSVQNRNRKVFMLWDTEPAREVSGGTWYHDGEFATNLIESLRECCQQYLENNVGRTVGLQEIYQFVLQQPNGQVPTEEDVECIMRTLELDEEVFSMPTATGRSVYRLQPRGPSGQPFDLFAGRLPQRAGRGPAQEPGSQGLQGLQVPCLSCPLTDECRVGGRISPEKCEYIANWLRGIPADPGGRGTGDTEAHALTDW